MIERRKRTSEERLIEVVRGCVVVYLTMASSIAGFYGTIATAFTMLVDILTTGRLPDLVELRAIISKVLGYAVVIGASIIKLPQIINVINSGSVEGMHTIITL